MIDGGWRGQDEQNGDRIWCLLGFIFGRSVGRSMGDDDELKHLISVITPELHDHTSASWRR